MLPSLPLSLCPRIISTGKDGGATKKEPCMAAAAAAATTRTAATSTTATTSSRLPSHNLPRGETAESEVPVLKGDCLALGKSSGKSEAAPPPMTAKNERKQLKSSLNADAKEFKHNQKASAIKSGPLKATELLPPPKSTTSVLAQQLLKDGNSGAMVDAASSEALAVSERYLRPGT